MSGRKNDYDRVQDDSGFCEHSVTYKSFRQHFVLLKAELLEALHGPCLYLCIYLQGNTDGWADLVKAD